MEPTTQKLTADQPEPSAPGSPIAASTTGFAPLDWFNGAGRTRMTESEQRWHQSLDNSFRFSFAPRFVCVPERKQGAQGAEVAPPATVGEADAQNQLTDECDTRAVELLQALLAEDAKSVSRLLAFDATVGRALVLGREKSDILEAPRTGGGVDYNSIDGTFDSLESTLVCAVRCGNAEVAEHLLRQGALSRETPCWFAGAQRGSQGPIEIAVADGDAEMVKLLWAPSAAIPGFSPHRLARDAVRSMSIDSVDAVAELAAAGGYQDALQTLLWEAIENRAANFAKIALARGANPDDRFATSLLQAVRSMQAVESRIAEDNLGGMGASADDETQDRAAARECLELLRAVADVDAAVCARAEQLRAYEKAEGAVIEKELMPFCSPQTRSFVVSVAPREVFPQTFARVEADELAELLAGPPSPARSAIADQRAPRAEVGASAGPGPQSGIVGAPPAPAPVRRAARRM